jgi:hypothetical protein
MRHQRRRASVSNHKGDLPFTRREVADLPGGKIPRGPHEPGRSGCTSPGIATRSRAGHAPTTGSEATSALVYGMSGRAYNLPAGASSNSCGYREENRGCRPTISLSRATRGMTLPHRAGLCQTHARPARHGSMRDSTLAADGLLSTRLRSTRNSSSCLAPKRLSSNARRHVPTTLSSRDKSFPACRRSASK